MEKERAELKRRYLRQQLEEENEDYASKINERAMYRYTAQYNANRLSDALREQLKDTRGRQAVMGGTDEQVAEQMRANANAMGDYVGQVEMQEEQRKKELEEAHKQRKRELNAAAVDAQDQYLAGKAGREAARSQATATAVTGAINAAGSVAGSMSGMNMKSAPVKTEQTQPTTTMPKIGFENIKVDVSQPEVEKLPGADIWNIPGKREYWAQKHNS